jgi:hypothetical protein
MSLTILFLFLSFLLGIQAGIIISAIIVDKKAIASWKHEILKKWRKRNE